MRVATLVTFSQFCTLHPDRRAVLVDVESLILDDELEIQVLHIVSLAVAPTSILVFDMETCTFEQMGMSVSAVYTLV